MGVCFRGRRGREDAVLEGMLAGSAWDEMAVAPDVARMRTGRHMRTAGRASLCAWVPTFRRAEGFPRARI